MGLGIGQPSAGGCPEHLGRHGRTSSSAAGVDVGSSPGTSLGSSATAPSSLQTTATTPSPSSTHSTTGPASARGQPASGRSPDPDRGPETPGGRRGDHPGLRLGSTAMGQLRRHLRHRGRGHPEPGSHDRSPQRGPAIPPGSGRQPLGLDIDITVPPKRIEIASSGDAMDTVDEGGWVTVSSSGRKAATRPSTGAGPPMSRLAQGMPGVRALYDKSQRTPKDTPTQVRHPRLHAALHAAAPESRTRGLPALDWLPRTPT